MDSTIIVAIIAFLGTVAGSFFAHRTTTALIAQRLEQLEKKVDLHNRVVERVYDLEERAAVHEEKLKVVDHRIDDLEKGA